MVTRIVMKEWIKSMLAINNEYQSEVGKLNLQIRTLNVLTLAEFRLGELIRCSNKYRRRELIQEIGRLQKQLDEISAIAILDIRFIAQSLVSKTSTKEDKACNRSA
jgi:hypothetical protein